MNTDDKHFRLMKIYEVIGYKDGDLELSIDIE